LWPRARAGMESEFVRGHTVSGSPLSVMGVATLILSKWGVSGQPHPPIGSLPAGLVDAVRSRVVRPLAFHATWKSTFNISSISLAGLTRVSSHC